MVVGNKNYLRFFHKISISHSLSIGLLSHIINATIILHQNSIAANGVISIFNISIPIIVILKAIS
jgi:hypothetical protein